MSEPTVTLRFPQRIHTRAKVAAAEKGMSLQDFVEQSVEHSMRDGIPLKPLSPTAARIAALPKRSQALVAKFIDLLEIAPDFYVRSLEQFVAGVIPTFRHLGKR